MNKKTKQTQQEKQAQQILSDSIHLHKPKDRRVKGSWRKKDAHEGSLLSRVLSSASLADKIEAIKEVNPYFYLLTPLPKRKQNESDESNYTI